jgi:iron(III) transport system substrate-binding protein
MSDFPSHAAWLLLTPLLLAGCARSPEGAEVVVYASLDQVYSQPILERFERDTGVRVRAVYDTEATKTTGLANRLLAEKDAPQADVFWNSEVVRTLVLEREGVLAPYVSPAAAGIPAAFRDPDGYWTGFAARVRVLAVNPSLLPRSEWPASVAELTDARWKGRSAIAYPLFGTTSAHVAALFTVWGAERATAWLESLASNGVEVVDGNSTARDLVVSGRVPLALTDSDDVASARARGDAIEMIFPDASGEGALVIPNTVALIAGAPHPEDGKRLIDYLLSPEVELALSQLPGAQIPLRDEVPWPGALPPRETLRPMQVDYDALAGQLDVAMAAAREIFVR